MLAAWKLSPAARRPAGGCCKRDLAPGEDLLAQIVQNLISYNYKILTDHKPHPQSPLSQAARHSWQTSSHPWPYSPANPEKTEDLIFLSQIFLEGALKLSVTLPAQGS